MSEVPPWLTAGAQPQASSGQGVAAGGGPALCRLLRQRPRASWNQHVGLSITASGGNLCSTMITTRRVWSGWPVGVSAYGASRPSGRRTWCACASARAARGRHTKSPCAASGGVRGSDRFQCRPAVVREPSDAKLTGSTTGLPLRGPRWRARRPGPPMPLGWRDRPLAPRRKAGVLCVVPS